MFSNFCLDFSLFYELLRNSFSFLQINWFFFLLIVILVFGFLLLVFHLTTSVVKRLWSVSCCGLVFVELVPWPGLWPVLANVPLVLGKHLSLVVVTSLFSQLSNQAG